MAGSSSGVLITKNGDDVDIVLLKGKTIYFTLTYGGASPINVTSFTAKLRARRALGNEALVEFSSANGRVTMGGSNGLVTFNMTAADSANLTSFEGVWDLELTTDAGAVLQVSSGKFKVTG